MTDFILMLSILHNIIAIIICYELSVVNFSFVLPFSVDAFHLHAASCVGYF